MGQSDDLKCPVDWCAAPGHPDGSADGTHIQKAIPAPMIGGGVGVAAFFDENSRRAGVSVGQYEFTADQLAGLESAIAEAKQKAASAPC